MKFKTLHYYVLMGICSIATMSSSAQAAQKITLTNPTANERKEELVTFSRTALTQKVGIIKKGKYVQLQKAGRPVLVQYDDTNGDGQWDEIAILQSFAPKETITLIPKITDNPATIKVMVRAHVRQRHKLADESFADGVLRDTMPYNNQPTDFAKQKLPPYLTEGPAWENDKVGFRKYFDVRNANDIWGKVTNRMVLEEVGVDPTKIYHHFDSTWGMDILKVGKSLGAGGLALQIKVDGKDSLVRFGSNVQQTTYEQVADGPIRAIFRIKYKGWKVGQLAPITATEEISIWGGQYFYQNKITITGAPVGSKLVTGINNFYTPEYLKLQTAKARGIYTYGVQSENKDNLGLAVITPSKNFYADGQTPETGDVKNTFFISQNILKGQPLSYRFYSAWEKSDERFSTKEGFEKFIQAETEKLGNEIIVK